METEQITKKCTRCKKELTKDLFYSRKKDGKEIWYYCCKKCTLEYAKQRRLKGNNREIAKACSKQWRKDNPERERFVREQWKIKDRYNITLAEYDVLLESQVGICAICGGVNTNNNRLCVDHCHKSLKVRGLLCHSCNRGLGNFNDDIKLLSKAIKYLKEYYNGSNTTNAGSGYRNLGNRIK